MRTDGGTGAAGAVAAGPTGAANPPGNGGGTRTGTVAALGVLLGWLREQGYRVVLPDAPAEPGRAGAPAPGDAG